MDRLPTELLSQIFAHIPLNNDHYQCTLVNRTFYSQANPLLWRHLTIDTNDGLDHIITSLTNARHAPGEHVRSLSFLGSCKITDADLIALLHHLLELEHLKLDDFFILPEGSTTRFYSYLPRSLTSLCIFSGHLSQGFLEALGQRCPRLASVKWEDCSYLESDFLTPLQHCPLTSLTVSCFHQHVMAPGFAETTARGLAHHPQLTALEIRDYRNNYTPMVALLLDQGTTWPQLTHLSLSGCNTLGDTLAIRFIQAHPTLTSLTLDTCSITDKTLDAICECLPSIQTLDVNGNSGLTLAALDRLVKHCVTLTDDVSCSLCGIVLSEEVFERQVNANRYYAYLEQDGFEVVAVCVPPPS